ncbi:MAG: hypothetical protein LQ352_005338 [Teloschistes flavicans]|nr:MAG: hypothetical protein LQ352_005338 [Teloschistes flavicans]
MGESSESTELEQVAQCILCQRNHQWQTEDVVRKWKLKIEDSLNQEEEEQIHLEPSVSELSAQLAQLTAQLETISRERRERANLQRDEQSDRVSQETPSPISTPQSTSASQMQPSSRRRDVVASRRDSPSTAPATSRSTHRLRSEAHPRTPIEERSNNPAEPVTRSALQTTASSRRVLPHTTQRRVENTTTATSGSREQQTPDVHPLNSQDAERSSADAPANEESPRGVDLEQAVRSLAVSSEDTSTDASTPIRATPEPRTPAAEHNRASRTISDHSSHVLSSAMHAIFPWKLHEGLASAKQDVPVLSFALDKLPADQELIYCERRRDSVM